MCRVVVKSAKLIIIPQLGNDGGKSLWEDVEAVTSNENGFSMDASDLTVTMVGAV